MLGLGNAPAESLHLLCGVRVEQLLQLAVAAGLDAQHAEAVLGVMEGDALDRYRQHLGGLRAGLGRIGETGVPRQGLPVGSRLQKPRGS